MPRKPTASPFEISWRGLNLSGTATFYAGRPGVTSGPPERCYPDEPPEVDVETLTCEGSNALFLLDSTLSGEIEELIVEDFEVEPDYPEYEPEDLE